MQKCSGSISEHRDNIAAIRLSKYIPRQPRNLQSCSVLAQTLIVQDVVRGHTAAADVDMRR